jgi:hypothetical protein
MAINLYSKASVDSLLSPKLSISSLTNAAATTLNATAPTTDQVLSYDGTELKWATVAGGGGAAWGGITGTLSSQTDLQNALDLKAPLASPTFTGTVTIPAGASIDGYLTTSTASSTYLAKASNLSDLANTGTARTNLGLGGLAVLNDAPSNGSQYARQDGAWAVVTGGGGGGGGVDIQTFGSSTTSGTFTWTKPAGAKMVEVYLMGGGSGGGSGARYATTSGRSGGGGGAGGAIIQARINAAFLGATQAVVVGAGGAGGASRTTDNGNGFSGSVGGATSFSIFQTGSVGGASGGNTSSGSQAFANSASLFGIAANNVGAGAQGRTTSGGSGNSTTGTYAFGLGGGGGAGAVASSVVANGGGTGGSIVGNSGAGLNVSVAGGTGGQGLTSTPATAGISAGTQYFIGSTGGGGGGYRTATGGSLLNGGNGGWPSSGGGGGGASDNGFASGAGGAGANGFAVIITYC